MATEIAVASQPCDVVTKCSANLSSAKPPSASTAIVRPTDLTITPRNGGENMSLKRVEGVLQHDPPHVGPRGGDVQIGIQLLRRARQTNVLLAA